jgi:redox-sensing transcriptional repressor
MAKRSSPRRLAGSKAADDKPSSVSKAVVSRLSLYLRELQRVAREGHDTISSVALGQRLGCTDAQVRKDLANFGQFGHRGVGYRCNELIEAIRRILGTHEPWAVALVGVGNLGRALLGYRGFPRQGFRFVAALDADPKKVGLEVEGLRVHPLDDLPRIVRHHKIRLGVIAVPASAAQEVADRMAAAGIEGILNFAPVTISLPAAVSQVGVDVAIELEQLAFSVLRRTADGLQP